MILRGSVHAALVAVHCLLVVMERYSPSHVELVRDGRVTTQGATQRQHEEFRPNRFTLPRPTTSAIRLAWRLSHATGPQVTETMAPDGLGSPL